MRSLRMCIGHRSHDGAMTSIQTFGWICQYAAFDFNWLEDRRYFRASAVAASERTIRCLQKCANYFLGGGFRLFRAAPGRRRAFRFRALWEAFCARLSSIRRNARPNDSRRASKPMSAAGGCTIITMSRATNHSLWVRNKCRRRLLIRFRVWALPTLRETVSPTRPRPLGARFPITTRAEVVPRLPTR